MEENQALFDFAAGYLNEDWPDFFADEWAALDAFIEGQPDSVGHIAGEIRWVLDRYPTEAATKSYMEDLGCGFVADWDGGTYRGWLEEVARRVTAALGSPPAP